MVAFLRTLMALFGRILNRRKPPVPQPDTPQPGATVPLAPTGVFGTAGASAITVNWNVPGDGGSSILSFMVARYEGSAVTPAATVVLTGAAVSNYVWAGLSVGVSYSFEVTATNAVGTGPVSGRSASVQLFSAPNAVTSLLATAGSQTVSATWVAATGNGLPVLDYTATLKSGPTTVATQTVTGLSVTFNGLTNDVDFTVQVTARNAQGIGPSAVSGTVQTNWPAVVLEHHGAWSEVNYPSAARIVVSQKTGNYTATVDAIEMNHVLNSGESVNYVRASRTKDRILQGDEWLFYAPFIFTSSEWSSDKGVSTFFRLTNGTQERLSMRATHSGLTFHVGGAQLAGRSWGLGVRNRDQWQYLWVRVKFSSDPSVGWVEWGIQSQALSQANGLVPASTNLLGRTFAATMPESDAYLMVDAGNINGTALPSGTRRTTHKHITGWLERTGVTPHERHRFDMDGDRYRVGYQNWATNPTGISDPTYSEMVSNAMTDRIQVVSVGGRLAWRHTVKPNDTQSNGQRSEISLVHRWNETTSPTYRCAQFLEGDKTVIDFGTWFPDATEFPLNLNNKFWLITQIHQLAESGGSPPHEFVGASVNQDLYQYRWNQTPAEASANTGLNTSFAEPPVRQSWYDFRWTIYHSDDPTKGYVMLTLNGTTVLSKTYRRTLYLADGSTLSGGEVIGEDIPELNFFSIGLYEEKTSNGGYNVNRAIYHSPATITLYRDPSARRAIDTPSF